jgi:bifunctional non-homologous end joining protein LigD
MGQQQALKIRGRSVSVSNLDKLLYPAAHFTKAQVIDYYIRVSKYLLPHLKDRPVTLKRYPDGVHSEHFYEKDAPSFTPEWVRTVPVPRRGGGQDINYIIIDDLPTLVWCANLANLEIHPFLHRAPELDTPTHIVFDLDPGGGADIFTCAEVAFLLKDVLDRLALKSFAKVSGSKGIQVYVPLNTTTSYDLTQPFARTVAELLETRHPNLMVAEMAKVARTGRVFIDWSQNADFKTTVGVYSLRAKRERPYVSMPVRWGELEAVVAARDKDALYFTPDEAIERLKKVRDLFGPVLKLRQELPEEFVNQLGRLTPVRTTSTPKSLAEYTGKRNFRRSPEPDAVPRASKQGGRRRFVVQMHAASHLHFDFRLEVHGVLKSWAVPKGVPYALDERRLAMATEDHPIDYLEFEGIIPQGQYGGGTVMVWDTGTYEVVEGNYYKGRLHIFLQGKKLKGDWLLTRDPAEAKKWSLAKIASAMKPPSEKAAASSGLSGRTMDEISAGATTVWHSNRTPAVHPELAKLPTAAAEFIDPMQCKLVAVLPESEGWQYEIKLDGYRALAVKHAGKTRLLSRRNNVLNARFAAIAEAFDALADDTVLDGEIVALDAEGQPSFNLLQNYHTRSPPMLYYVFDLPVWQGRSLMELPLSRRRDLLRLAVRDLRDPVRVSEPLPAGPAELVAAAREQGVEGLIAKRLSSRYEGGKRSGAWVKLKLNRSHELVVGGYIPSTHGFDSLLVGYYRGDALIFMAKIRNGFVPEARREVLARLRPLETERCPFANLPEPKSARRGEALTAQVMKKCRWVRPELVVQIEYTDWTTADHLRHSRFAGIREDKNPKLVAKEEVSEV